MLDDDIVQEFLTESWENLARLDNEVVTLEREPDNADLLASVFRTIHTIKGACGFLGLTGLGAVAHSAENVLGCMREGKLAVTGPLISLVLQAVDVIKELLTGLEATGQEPAVDSAQLIVQLDAAAEGNVPVESAAVEVNSTEVDTAADVADDPVALEAAASLFEGDALPTIEELREAMLSGSSATPPPTTDADTVIVDTALTDIDTTAVAAPETSATGSFSPMTPSDTSLTEPADAAATAGLPRKSVADLSIRVNVEVLDNLMNLVGELVLSRNQLLQLGRGDEESKYAAPIGHLNRVTTDLQEEVMKTRMQPIGSVWSKLPRLVRDVAQVTGRQIELELNGAETELDRTVLEAIRDPLTHMIRNSADHGIEPPDRRREVGKSETGRISLNAWHEGGHVIISLEDDGAGINAKKVVRRAIESGIISEADASRMSQQETLSLIFRPGFSTATEVSAVSGRGVGMDVVKTEIDRIGGTVDLTSIEGQGTTVRIKIPLTLAIISALVVDAGGESFAIPQLGVVELVRLTAEDRKRIERIHNQEVFRLRDRLLPLVYLHEALELNQASVSSDSTEAEETKAAEPDTNIVVVQVGEEQLGVVVSRVHDTEEIVVKPVGRLLKDLAIYQGTTILGDGQVITILDVAGLAARCGALSHNTQRTQKRVESAIDQGDSSSLLLFDVGATAPSAVPLSLVSRLEEFPLDQIEQVGDRYLVQYRGELLPLLPLASAGQKTLLDPQPCIVFSENDHSMGIIVDRILDVIQEPLIIRMRTQRPGVLGTAVLNGRATDIIDTQHYVMEAHPAWFERGQNRSNRNLLVVDDSLFFRQLVGTSLESEGYHVVTVDSGEKALELFERGGRFDAIVLDIEMPGMDGFEFGRRIRDRALAQGCPVIAVSGVDIPPGDKRAVESGFARVLEKFDPEVLLATLSELSVNQTRQTGATA